MARLQHKHFLANGSWTCPAGVKKIWVWAFGGGGGGGGGCAGSNSSTVFHSSGGGGGGGAKAEIVEIDVVPGTTYNVTIGGGGAGGTVGSGNGGAGGFGGDGGDTEFDDGGSLRYTWPGAHGGGQGVGASICYGGGPARGAVDEGVGYTGTTQQTDDGFGLIAPGYGGWGVANNTSPSTAWPGMRQVQQRGTNDGTSGTRSSGGGNGANSTGQGGGGGGGGGNGGWGVGGQGGTGGASGGATGSAGGVGNAAGPTANPANTGAGGGGGGGGGYGSATSGNGGVGGAGGSGRLVISFIA